MAALPPVPSPGTPPGSGRSLARVSIGPGGMTVECLPCRLSLEQHPGADPAAALRAFLEAHPLTRHARHRTDLPQGWLPRLVGASTS